MIEATTATETVFGVNGRGDLTTRSATEAGVDPTTSYTRSRITTGVAQAVNAGDVIRSLDFKGCVFLIVLKGVCNSAWCSSSSSGLLRHVAACSGVGVGVGVGA